MNMLTRKDIQYLNKKHNVMKKKHENSMIAVALKVKEWNANGKNYCFFFKQQGMSLSFIKFGSFTNLRILGESHPILHINDFCIGFMNDTMERKLLDYSRIICMDGTHCTNQKGMDLTIMLVKDDMNKGFPVAFMLSNRLDQVVQEVFLQALRDKLKLVIEPEYFMTDDDAKYHNAWVKTMGTKPRRLLCSWHIIKNWIIQGRSKGMVHGLAYAISGDDAIPYLSKRECELGGYITHFTDFFPPKGKPFKVLLYVATCKNPLWLGDGRSEEIARQIADSSGPSGHNVEYVVRLANFMREHFPEHYDAHLFDLEKEILNIVNEKKMCLTTIMGSGKGCVKFIRKELADASSSSREASPERIESFEHTTRVPEKALRCLNI